MVSCAALPEVAEVAMLRVAGCAGLALAWSDALERALADGRWAAAAGVALAS